MSRSQGKFSCSLSSRADLSFLSSRADVVREGSAFPTWRQTAFVITSGRSPRGICISHLATNCFCHHERTQSARDLHFPPGDKPLLSSRADAVREGSAFPTWRQTAFVITSKPVVFVITSGRSPRGICISMESNRVRRENLSSPSIPQFPRKAIIPR